jgi:hypothetical protein
MSSSKEIKEDFLAVDNPIPGQNYVCLSFVSPEEVILNKSSHFVSKFVQSVCGAYKFSEEPTIEELKAFRDHVTQHLTPEGCDEKYKDFLFARQEELEKEYYEKNNFQTTIRGLKVRGVYDTLKEAQHRAKEIQRLDRNFNVYVAQVGYWLPWDPQPQKIANQEYLEEGLNTLVKKYQENQKAREQHFQENIDYVKEQSSKALEEHKKVKETATSSDSLSDLPPLVEETSEDEKRVFTEEDPWLKHKSQ